VKEHLKMLRSDIDWVAAAEGKQFSFAVAHADKSQKYKMLILSARSIFAGPNGWCTLFLTRACCCCSVDKNRGNWGVVEIGSIRCSPNGQCEPALHETLIMGDVLSYMVV
jgi:hypothetical protein